MEGRSATAVSVQVVSQRMVRPASSPPPVENDNGHHQPTEEEAEVIHLTPWDLRLITIDYIQKGLLLPKPPAGGDALVDVLESSFARALARFYPFTGRHAAEEREDGTVTVSLRCTGEGAEFVHAAAPGVAVADVVSSLYTPPVVREFFPLAQALGADAVVEPLPVLSVQVTELADGVFIGMSLNHSVADGTAFWHFVNTWSEINRGVGVELSTPSPVLRRWCRREQPGAHPHAIFFFQTRDPPRNFITVVTKSKFTKAQSEFKSYYEAFPTTRWRPNSGLQLLTTQRVAVRQAGAHRAAVRAHGGAGVLLHLPGGERPEAPGAGQRRDGVRRQCHGVRQGGGHRRRYRGEGPRVDGVAAEPRHRVVRRGRREGVAGAVGRVAGLHVHGGPVSSGGTAVVTGSSPRSDVFGNDFGWGRPVAVRSGGGNKADGKATVFEGPVRGGSMSLEVCIAPEALARLVSDDEFMEAVSLSLPGTQTSLAAAVMPGPSAPATTTTSGAPLLPSPVSGEPLLPPPASSTEETTPVELGLTGGTSVDSLAMEVTAQCLGGLLQLVGGFPLVTLWSRPVDSLVALAMASLLGVLWDKLCGRWLRAIFRSYSMPTSSPPLPAAGSRRSFRQWCRKVLAVAYASAMTKLASGSWVFLIILHFCFPSMQPTIQLRLNIFPLITNFINIRMNNFLDRLTQLQLLPWLRLRRQPQQF